MLNRRELLKILIGTGFTIGLNALLPAFASYYRESIPLDRYPFTFPRMDVEYFYEQ